MTAEARSERYGSEPTTEELQEMALAITKAVDPKVCRVGQGTTIIWTSPRDGTLVRLHTTKNRLNDTLCICTGHHCFCCPDPLTAMIRDSILE